jgi:hypothetical protein
VPAKKTKRTSEGGKGRPRALGKLRAKRYSTWKELRAATLEWCWAEVEREMGGPVDRDQWRAFLADWFRAVDDEPRRLWREVRDALVRAADYLDANPEAARAIYYGYDLNELISFACYHQVNAAVVNGGDPSEHNVHRGSIRGWIESARRGGPRTNPEDWSCRTRLVRSVLGPIGGKWWWGSRKPTVRDLAIMSLLVGNEPEGALKQQRCAAGDADRPTVLDVVAAEENAIRAAKSRKRT